MKIETFAKEKEVILNFGTTSYLIMYIYYYLVGSTPNLLNVSTT